MSILILILLLTQKIGIYNNTTHGDQHTPGFYALLDARLNRERNAITAKQSEIGPRHEYNLALMRLIDKYNANPRTKNKVSENFHLSQKDMQNILNDDIANHADRQALNEITSKNSAYALLNDTIDFLHTQAHRPAITRPFYNLAFLIKNRHRVRTR